VSPVKMAEPIEMSYIGRGLVEANKPRIMRGPGSPGEREMRTLVRGLCPQRYWL